MDNVYIKSLNFGNAGQNAHLTFPEYWMGAF
jgi:hypothetical protein